MILHLLTCIKNKSQRFLADPDCENYHGPEDFDVTKI